MKVVGYIFLIIVGIGVVAAIAIALRSIPDIKRYARIRKM